MSQEIILSPASSLDPAPLFTPTPQAARRMLEFFTAQINNPHTRRAYLNAARRFHSGPPGPNWPRPPSSSTWRRFAFCLTGWSPARSWH